MNRDKMTGVQLGLERAKTDFFEYKGRKYPAGTVFKMKNPEYSFLDDVTAIFMGSLPELYGNKWAVGYNTNVDIASNIAYRTRKRWKTIMPVEKDKLEDMIVEIFPGNHYVEMETKRKRYVSDLDDANLVAKWGMYITLMIVSSIFNGRIIGWIILTVIFFVWRHNYREENCVYYE